MQRTAFLPAVILRRLPYFALLAVFAMLLPAAARAQQVDVIRGRVTGPDSTPLEGVVVTATSIPNGVNRTARTDRAGRYTITFPGGDGNYMMQFAIIGYAARRFELRRNSDEEILIADARLQRVGNVLDAVEVTAPRERVARNESAQPDVGGSEQAIVNPALPADQLGDLAAMAASLPGVQLVPGEDGGANGFSVLGLGADQNNTTLNGMNFGGSSLPRDAAVSSSLATSPYDVSRGGFSGGQFTLRTGSGSNFLTRGTSLNLDAPQLQWSDRASAALGQEYSNVSIGGRMSGPIRYDRSFYNVSYQAGRRASDYQSLLNTGPLGLQAAGVSSDSVARFLSILQGEGVPVATRRIPRSRYNDNGSVFGAMDFSPPSSSRGSAINVSFNGSWSTQDPATGATTELPASSGERTQWRGGIQARHSTYFGFGILSETSVGISGSINESSPFLAMPAGRVRVASTFEDGDPGVALLTFGGSAQLDGRQTSSQVGYTNQLSWFTLNNKHRVKLTSELRRDGYSQQNRNNMLGTFSFNSLADLQAGTPAMFTRTLTAREAGAGQLIAGLSLGDAYRRSRDVQVQYGVRLDANRFLERPAANAVVESTFGTSNAFVPNRVYLSPRVGFSWTYGTAPQIAGFEGAARIPRAVVRGGVGLFQGTPSVNSINGVLENTGLAGATQTLTCVGSAAPTPDWDAWAANPSLIPDRCADGSTGTPFADQAPAVSLFSRDFVAPRSIRSNLQWSGPVIANRFTATVDATFSLNQRQQSFADLNFNGQQRFALGAEADRPVYVQPSSIVPQTGTIASRDSRVSPLFGRVAELRSDLTSQSQQLSVRLSPTRFSSSFNWSLAYVASSVREQFRGFTSTAGNPLAIDRARSPMDSRHQFTYTLGYNFFDAVRVNWFGTFRSGTPFTPMVTGDVNGDGYGGNDRAFVFDPAGAGVDPAVAAGMQRLLDGAPDYARECLVQQLGTIAGRTSCQGPWTSTANLSISFNPAKVRMPQRATLSLNLSNPLGAADLLVNGSDNLRGWGQPAFPDQALLYVRGFDPNTNRFQYQVNERFGRTNSALAAFRAPMTLTAMMRFDVGPTRERQMLTQQLDRGRRTQGQKAPEMLVRAMFGNGGIPNPLATILRQQDSLKLTPQQADSMATLNRWYSIRLDSIWSPIAREFAALPDDYDRDAAYDRYIRARRSTVDILSRLSDDVKGLLTADQRRRLPAFVASYLDPRYLASIRSGTASFTGNTSFGGAGAMGGAMVMGGGGGGGMRVEIVR